MDTDYLTAFLIMVGCSVPLVIPIIFGAVILKNSWKDEISRLIGLLTLKSAAVFSIFFYLFGIVWNGGGIIVPLALYVFLTLSLTYLFRESLKKNFVARLPLIGDFACWPVAFALFIFWNNLGVTISVIFLPTIFATLSLLYVFRRSDLLKCV